MVAGLQRIVDLLRTASGASSVTGQPAAVYVCHCMHVLGAEAAEDSKWGALLPEEINPRVDELNASLSQGACDHSSLGAYHVARVGLPRPHRAAYYAADRLHLSAAGYEALVPQLLALVPALIPALPRMTGKRHGKRRIGQDADETSSRASSPRRQRVRETPTRAQ